MNNSKSTLIELIGERRVKQNESLVTHTILKREMVAEMYIEVDALDDLIKIVKAAQGFQIPVYILGGGARIPAGGDIDGLVIKNNCRRFDKVQGELVFAESGVIMNQLVRYTIEEGLAGLEYQLGLPGTVGGAICTNAKFIPNYVMVNQSLQSIRILHENGEIQTYNGQLPHFVYTGEGWEDTKDIILSAAFKLTPSDKKVLWERGEEAVAWRTEEGKKRK